MGCQNNQKKKKLKKKEKEKDSQSGTLIRTITIELSPKELQSPIIGVT